MATTVVTPAKPTVTPIPVPPTFATEVAKAEHMAAQISTYLNTFGLTTLQHLETLLSTSTPLPWGLDKYRQEVLSFLPNAIAYVQDAISAAELVAQLDAASAIPVTPAS